MTRGNRYSTGNAIVDENAKPNISGNIIPQVWYKTIIGDSGKPNLSAIIILAYIVYWYIQRNRISGKAGSRKKVKEKNKDRTKKEDAEMMFEMLTAETDGIEVKKEKVTKWK